MSVAGLFIVLLALAFATLPFVNQRLFGVLPLRRGEKSGWWRLLELLVLYFVVGTLARVLEGQVGTVFPQEWQFYAITGALFLVAAFPGFTFRYLLRRAPRRVAP
ncbi:DUF2818 family protein [Chitinasiproducens palmae]|uniref:DUF2818 family protein n=1 Tax=Chitinasiproducens palmae TaxID=1770053 RepID=A0A1H2PSJ8_9BURK|nr:DUF2818 family protein [Chitinasiproducens palmae]SDV49995.1 Protein of unknown function [Chitinasiproducens palmae]